MKKFKMTQEEAQTVVDAIVVWEESNSDEEREDCPLCNTYHCTNKCPIKRYTGLNNCHGTPMCINYPTYSHLKKAMIAFGIKMLSDAGYEIKEI